MCLQNNFRSSRLTRNRLSKRAFVQQYSQKQKVIAKKKDEQGTKVTRTKINLFKNSIKSNKLP